MAILSSVRTARHDGYERIVFQFREPGAPDYVVEYAKRPPTRCGSGAEITVAGKQYLTVRMSPAQAHAPVGDDERSTIPSRSMVIASPVVAALALSCDFEAVLSWVIGIDAHRPFRVTTLRSPPRIVIDVASR